MAGWGGACYGGTAPWPASGVWSSADDTFELYLDTFRDRRNAFYFAANPLGTQRDGLVRNEGEDVNWQWDGVSREMRTNVMYRYIYKPGADFYLVYDETQGILGNLPHLKKKKLVAKMTFYLMAK